MMTQELITATKHTLIIHEAYKKFPYLDSVGKITIGIGYNLSDRGIDDQWIQNKCNEDINYFYTCLREFPWFKNLNEARQIALINMCYNLGWKGFLSFKKMIKALESYSYQLAAAEALNSKWANQVGKRAEDIAYMIKFGKIPDELRREYYKFL